MGAFRSIAIGLLAVLVFAGGGAAVIGAASLSGLTRPIVVEAASMQPALAVGDLLLTTPVQPADLLPGDVVALRLERGQAYSVTRVVALERKVGDSWWLTTRADASGRLVEHTIYRSVWSPTLRIPIAGMVVERLREPGAALSALAVIAVLLVLALLIDPHRPRPARWTAPRTSRR